MKFQNSVFQQVDQGYQINYPSEVTKKISWYTQGAINYNTALKNKKHHW